MIYILGVNNFASYEATAALIRVPRAGGEIEYVTTAEERYSRVKHEYAFPLRGIHHCLQAFGLESLEQIDYIYTDHARVPRWLNSGPGYRKLEHDYFKLRLNFPRERIRVVDHHDGHAAGAFYPSPFSQAAVLVVDGLGSRSNTQTLYHFTRSGMRVVERGDYWGIGRLYALVTGAVLPYGPEKGYGKTMGLAPYGRVHPGPVLHFDSIDAGMSTDYSAFSTRAPLPRIVPGAARKCEDREAVLDPYFARAAFDVQQECERQMVRMAQYAYEQTGARHLCVTGGVGLNGLSNARILERTPFEDVWITPGCSDTGLPLGLALWGYFQDIRTATSAAVSVSMTTAYSGTPYAHDQVAALLNRYGVAHQKTTPEAVAGLIAAGKVIGWFEGGSEFGPRALGHRSILADPRDPEMKDTLNKRVKFREPYRPYAPSILEEHAPEWLELDRPSPFMLLVVQVRLEKRALVPAVTHVDYTTRPQTVTERANPNYYRLLKEFHRLTGVPMVLNTSLNINREPIVETPIDALICAFGTAIDYLYLDGELIECAAYARPELVQALKEERATLLGEEWHTITSRYLTRYDVAERDAYLAEENRIAEWHREYRAKYELEHQLGRWKADRTSVLIVGTRAHTCCLYEYIDGFPQLDVAGFVPLDDRPGEAADFTLYPETTASAVDWTAVGAVLVSTHEYQGLVARELRGLVPAHVDIFTMYDEAGDSLLYVLPGRWAIVNDLPNVVRSPAIEEKSKSGVAVVDIESDSTPVGYNDRYAVIARFDAATSREVLDRQLKAITQNFVCTTVGQLTDPTARLPEVVAVVTFDAASLSDDVMAILQRWRVPATLFCTADPGVARVTIDGVRRCQDSGIEVGIAAPSRWRRGELTDEEQRSHVQARAEYFKSMFGLSRLLWAHPGGVSGAGALTPRSVLQACGFSGGVTRVAAIVKPSDLRERWKLPRFDAKDLFDASNDLRPDRLNALFVAD